MNKDDYNAKDKFTQPARGIRPIGTEPSPEEIDRIALEKAKEFDREDSEPSDS